MEDLYWPDLKVASVTSALILTASTSGHTQLAREAGKYSLPVQPEDKVIGFGEKLASLWCSVTTVPALLMGKLKHKGVK